MAIMYDMEHHPHWFVFCNEFVFSSCYMWNLRCSAKSDVNCVQGYISYNQFHASLEGMIRNTLSNTLSINGNCYANSRRFYVDFDNLGNIDDDYFSM